MRIFHALFLCWMTLALFSKKISKSWRILSIYNGRHHYETFYQHDEIYQIIYREKKSLFFSVNLYYHLKLIVWIFKCFWYNQTLIIYLVRQWQFLIYSNCDNILKLIKCKNLPSKSYTLKRKTSFSSLLWPANLCIVSMNSDMDTVPLPSQSKIRKARSTKKGWRENYSR